MTECVPLREILRQVLHVCKATRMFHLIQSLKAVETDCGRKRDRHKEPDKLSVTCVMLSHVEKRRGGESLAVLEMASSLRQP